MTWLLTGICHNSCVTVTRNFFEWQLDVKSEHFGLRLSIHGGGGGRRNPGGGPLLAPWLPLYVALLDRASTVARSAGLSLSLSRRPSQNLLVVTAYRSTQSY